MAKAPPEPPIRRHWGLTVAEWLTAGVGLGSTLIGLGSLAVAWLTYENGKDTSDLKHAIASLTVLAEQTKRQAEASSGQLAVLRDQVGEAKKQTKAISQQTTAIKASSDANVKSADAQKRAADIGASAVKAAVAITAIKIDGLKSEPTADDQVSLGLQVSFRNVGGSAIHTEASQVALYLGSELPPHPSLIGTARFGGANEYVADRGVEFGMTDAIHFNFPKDAVQGVLDGSRHVFVFGIFNYTDAANLPGRWCFAFQVEMKDGVSKAFRTAGGPAYHCAQ